MRAPLVRLSLTLFPAFSLFMAYDAALLAKRNERIIAEYKRLRTQKMPIKSGATSYGVLLTYRQVLDVLSDAFCISVRRLEQVVAHAHPATA